jgi:hypothetical protein
MRKAIIRVLAAVVALAAAPLIAVSGQVPKAYAYCFTTGNLFCCIPPPRNCVYIAQPPRPVQTPAAPPRPAPPPYVPPRPVPVQTPEVKPPPPPPPPPPTVVPVVTPKINPPAPGAPRNTSLVTPPTRLAAPPQSVTAAKTAPPTRINPATPPKPPTPVDFNRQVQNVVSTHSTNVDVVKADNQTLARPRHWDYVDYDAYHRPTLYNPLTEAMTFRYFYNGANREVYVPAGGSAVLDVATPALFPFTAVSDSYLASGSFYGGGWIPPDGWSGGAPPPDYTAPASPQVYQDVSAYVPAVNQTVQVGQVTVVGHDGSQPAGSQDTFMLDDNTLAWGQITDPSSGAQIRVTKTQSLPGVGPTDNGSFLVALVAHEQPTDNTWWLWPLGGVLVIAVGVIGWVVIRRSRAEDPTEQLLVGAPPDEPDEP